ncbi:FAD-binding oxidoreductase [Pelomonas sp. KK5]|uniref:FAD-binding oxidoreductase n=1 Tax=Pelomonas sp. KK5 TaxID=1855730 RepID=UPI00097C78EF|nr:FAD-binding oxidoreductase [Pelomonas sp. KK5]
MPFEVRLSRGPAFTASAGRSLLDCALDAGLHLEHSCRTGRCGTCKTKLLGGEVQTVGKDLWLSSQDRAEGWILTCTDAATTDCSLDAEDLTRLAGIATQTHPARIDTIERPAPDVVHVTLRLPPTAKLRYLPGQYVNVIGAGGLRRAYSLAQAPREDGRLELMIRQVDDGAMSAYWFGAAKANDLLRIEGPRGTFFLREVAGLDLVLLATGTGIAPIRALLTEIAALPAQPRSITLLWGGRRPQDLFWQPPQMPSLTYIPVLSRADESWTGERGHVQDVLLARRLDLASTVVYACGSQQMIVSAANSLCAQGLPAYSFHSDAFVASE